MKTLPNTSLRAAVALCLACYVVANQVNAAIQWWDPNGTTSVGGNGTWDTTTAQWTPAGTTTQVAAGSLTVWNSANAAGFCAGPASGVNQGTFTITVNSAITIAGIFNGTQSPGPCTLTISRSGSLNLAAGVDAFSDGGTGPPTGTTTITIP